MTDKLDFEELKGVGMLPSPSGVALTVMQQLQQEDISLPDLVHTILSDPALTGQIIKLANAVNPNISRPIASVTVDTLLIVGINAIRQAVIGLSLVATYQHGKCYAFDYQRFWLHSIAMACIARKIGSGVRIAPVSEVFTCGLLAEIGQLALATARPEAYSILLKQYSGKPLKLLVQAEIQQFGLGRRALTAAMMFDWGMPQIFIDVVSCYDTPESAAFASGSRPRNLALALRLAAQLADTYVAPDTIQAMLPDILASGITLDLGAEQVINIANQAANEWAEWCRSFNIKPKVVPVFAMPKSLGQG